MMKSISKISCLAALMVFLSFFQSSTQELWKNNKFSGENNYGSSIGLPPPPPGPPANHFGPQPHPGPQQVHGPGPVSNFAGSYGEVPLPPHPQPIAIPPVPAAYPQPQVFAPFVPPPANVIGTYQQPVLSNTGEIIIETLLAGIPFDCRGRPTGHWRDSKFCDVFHACVYGQQRKTYACPIVGERTYFDDVTKRCEFVTQNSCGNHAFYKK